MFSHSVFFIYFSVYDEKHPGSTKLQDSNETEWCIIVPFASCLVFLLDLWCLLHFLLFFLFCFDLFLIMFDLLVDLSFFALLFFV